MATFYNIYLLPQSGVAFEDVRQKMDAAINWYMYAHNAWIIKTNYIADAWQVHLKPLVDPSGALFICKLDIHEYQGWMPKQFWNWLRSVQLEKEYDASVKNKESSEETSARLEIEKV